MSKLWKSEEEKLIKSGRKRAECDCYIEHRETFTPALTSLPEPCAGCPWQGYYRQNFPLS